jgi:MYND finger
VVRCALSSLYPPQFIHKTKFQLCTLPSQLDPVEEDDFVEENEGDVGSLAVQETVREIVQEIIQETVQKTVQGTVPQEKVCNVCGKGGRLKKCGRCETVFYCGVECQKKDWDEHKGKCRRTS